MSLRRLRQLLTRSDERPFIAEDRLQRTPDQLARDHGQTPPCPPLIEALQRSLDPWAATASPDSWLKLVILPPGCDLDPLADWARQSGHERLRPPTRESLSEEAANSALDLDGEGVLVIPELAMWFLRRRGGLERLRLLLKRLAGLQRHCVVGCDSRAWRFICRALEAHLILPEPLSFPPFDEARLRGWLAHTLEKGALSATRFRLSRDGRDVFALDKRGRPVSDYFSVLAAHSAGVPWVAWHLWRRSLRAATDDDATPYDREQTLWVVALEAFSLPGQGDTRALLILHALLIHTALSDAALAQVLPEPNLTPLLSALRTAGFIERRHECWQVVPAALPATRSGLDTAGFPTDAFAY